MNKRISYAVIPILFLFAFFFRFWFGLNCPALLPDDDEVQTYVIGLKAFTTHTWPYFGPDLQNGGAAFNTQLPGALEGGLLFLFLKIWPAPESPYFFTNLVTFAALSFLAWYCHKRLPSFPPWFIFTWIYVSIWTTHFSTQVVNTSLSLVGAVLFFIGFMESVPDLSLNFLKGIWPNALMGFGFFWVLQLHMTWVFFVPFFLFSFYQQARTGAFKRACIFATVGAIPMWTLLIPTYLKYGFRTGHDLNGSFCFLSIKGVMSFFDVLGRYFSFACFELPRFIGDHTPERIQYLRDNPAITFPGYFLWVAGILQAVLMLVFWFQPKHTRPDWKGIKFLSLAVFIVLYLSFWFSIREPFAYRIYESLPIAMIYSFYCWDALIKIKFWRILGVVFILAAVYFQVFYTYKEWLRKESVYWQYRDRMAQALTAHDYRLLAERRPGTLY